jgi:uncharacterized protein (TIGR02145 family)
MKRIGNNHLVKYGVILCVPLLAGIIPSAHAEDSVVTTTAITISESCSMTGTINTPHNASVINGTYSGASYPNGIGQTTLKAFCNDSAGFAIYAIGYTDDEYGNTKLHSSTLGSTYDINTGIYNSGSASSSTWSMKLTGVSGTYAPTIADGTNGLENFTTWHVVPSTYTKVAYRTSGTDTDNTGSGIGSSLTTTYDAYVASTQPAGTYVGQVKYTLVHPNMTDNYNKPVIPITAEDCPGGWVCYAPNSGEIIGSMDSISNTKITSSPKAGKKNIGTGATSINLIAPNYSRPGYGFAGWSTKWDAVSAYNNNETVYIYGPIETITTADLLANENINFSTQGLILYPVWIASAGNLQGTDGQGWTGCSSLTAATYNSTTGKVEATLSSVTALKDTRDNNVYAVAKLADGKCWMIENLRLDDAPELSAANTHNPSLPLTNVYDTTNPTTSNHLSATTDPTTTAWCTSFSSACDDQSMLATNNTTLFTDNTSVSYSTESNVYSYGNYYNWYSATVGHGKYGSSYASGYVAPGDICPAGWHLPKGGNKSQESTNEFWQLITTGLNNGVNPANYDRYTTPHYVETEATPVSNALRSYPNNFVYSGNAYGDEVFRRGSHGIYWSSSAVNNVRAYILFFFSTGVYPGTYGDGSKNEGWMVRCVAGT